MLVRRGIICPKEVCRVSRVKFYISAVIFILITAVKLMSPTIAQELKYKLLPAIDQNTDYKAAMLALGERLTDDDGFISVLNSFYKDEVAEDEEHELEKSPVKRNASGYSPTTIGELRESFSVIVPKGESAGNSAGSKEEDTEPAQETMAEIPVEEPEQPVEEEIAEEPEEDKMPEAIAAFLESQREYSDYNVPENVSYTMPPLPFEYTSPVQGYTSSGFGYRLHPIADSVKFHYGTDFAANQGDDILAFADGVVLATGENETYGLYLIIGHGNGYETLYAHCSRILVSNGESVTKGQKIAYVGQTGETTGPHLHFELMKDGVYLNPEFYLNVL
ncbi:MAG: M23 family metallopeptidase [Oscillospiraceae bacterium]|jgi:murein DD-endopeptidase MepM/ murein hydrolase activator NlpD